MRIRGEPPNQRPVDCAREHGDVRVCRGDLLHEALELLQGGEALHADALHQVSPCQDGVELIALRHGLRGDGHDLSIVGGSGPVLLRDHAQNVLAVVLQQVIQLHAVLLRQVLGKGSGAIPVPVDRLSGRKHQVQLVEVFAPGGVADLHGEVQLLGHALVELARDEAFHARRDIAGIEHRHHVGLQAARPFALCARGRGGGVRPLVGRGCGGTGCEQEQDHQEQGCDAFHDFDLLFLSRCATNISPLRRRW